MVPNPLAVKPADANLFPRGTHGHRPTAPRIATPTRGEDVSDSRRRMRARLRLKPMSPACYPNHRDNFRSSNHAGNCGRLRMIVRGVDEFSELSVGDRRPIDVEAVQMHAM